MRQLKRLFLVAAAVLLTAATAARGDETGSITLKLTYRDGEETVNMKGGELSLFTVALVKDEKLDVSRGQFKDSSLVTGIPGMTTEELSSKNSELAGKLVKAAAGLTAKQTAKVTKGKAAFTGLEPGLYLIFQSEKSDGKREINPFLITIPDGDGKYSVSAAPKNGIVTPPPPEPTVTPTSPPGGGNRIPQTGQLWWPVPVLCIAGIALIAAGVLRRRQGRR